MSDSVTVYGDHAAAEINAIPNLVSSYAVVHMIFLAERLSLSMNALWHIFKASLLWIKVTYRAFEDER